jgi:predicted permease
MVNHMITAVNAVLPSFLIIALGLYIRSRGKLDDKSLGKFNSLAFRVFLPFQIFKNIYDSPMGEAFDLKLLIFGAVGLFIGLVLRRPLHGVNEFVEEEMHESGVL